MFEVFIYDSRDIDSKFPESYLGEADTMADGIAKISAHLAMFPEQVASIYRAEIVPKKFSQVIA